MLKQIAALTLFASTAVAGINLSDVKPAMAGSGKPIHTLAQRTSGASPSSTLEISTAEKQELDKHINEFKAKIEENPEVITINGKFCWKIRFGKNKGGTRCISITTTPPSGNSP